MNRGLAVRAGLAVQDPGRVDLGRVDPDPVLQGLVDRAGPADRDLGRGRVDLAVRDRAGPADIRDLAGLAARDRDLAGLAGRERADIRDRAGPVDLDRVDPDLVDQGMDRVALVNLVDTRDRVDLADQGMDRAGLVDLAGQVDRPRRRTHPGELSTEVALRWVGPGMRRTASAHPATARRPRPHNTDGVGMTGLRPEGRRLGGRDRRPRVAGTALRLPVVGTAGGTGPPAT